MAVKPTEEQEQILETWIAEQDLTVRRATILYNGKAYKKTDLYKIMDDMSVKELKTTGLIELADLNPTGFNRLFKDIVNLRKAKAVGESELALQDGTTLMQDFGIAELYWPKDYENTDGYVVYRKESLEIEDMNYKVIKRRFTTEEWSYMMPQIPVLKVEYDPYSRWKKKDVQVSGGISKFTKLNLYRSPSWSNVAVQRPQIPPLIKEYLEFLFSGEESREFVLAWLFVAMTGRCKTYLFLVGGEGAGKTLFAGLAERLIGEHNSVKAKEDFLRNNFNDIIENKRFVYLDEFHATTQKETDILKSRIEDTITLEGKHKDQKVARNYSSFMLLNNYFTSVRVDPSTGRKFSVPEITDKSLVIEKGQDFVDKLYKSIKSDNHIAHFAAYILEHYKNKIAPHTFLHTNRYERVTKESASEGMRRLINLLMVEGYEEAIVVKDVRSQHGRMGRGERFPSNLEVEKFFERFTWNGKRVGNGYYDDDEGLLLERHDDYAGVKI